MALPNSNLDDALVARLRLVPASRLAQEPARARLATGIALLDGALGGGWPAAALSELVGRRSAGRTSVLYASLAAAIARGQVVALIDAASVFDPRGAEAAGITLSRLLWIRAGARTLLPAAELLVAAGGFGLVAIDVGERPARVPSTAWLRLKQTAEKQGTAVVVTAPFRMAGATARAAVLLRDARPQFIAAGGPLLAGLETRAHIERALGSPAAAYHRRDGAPGNDSWVRFWARPR